MKTVKKYLNRYFVDAMGAMALGLFASLLIGTIFSTLAKYIPLTWLSDAFDTIAFYAKAATGMAIGVAIAHKLGAHPLVMFSAAAVGAMSNALGAVIDGGFIKAWAVPSGADGEIFYAAGPAGAFFAVIKITGVPIGRIYSINSKPSAPGSIISSRIKSKDSFSIMFAASIPS